MPVVQLTDDNFKEKIAENETIVVDFWAPWCGPCRMLAPVLDEIAAEGVVVGKVNVDECEALAAQYQIRSIPTLIVFKDGNAVKTNIGVAKKEDILAMVK